LLELVDDAVEIDGVSDEEVEVEIDGVSDEDVEVDIDGVAVFDAV